jgi:hypothetical protein
MLMNKVVSYNIRIKDNHKCTWAWSSMKKGICLVHLCSCEEGQCAGEERQCGSFMGCEESFITMNNYLVFNLGNCVKGFAVVLPNKYGPPILLDLTS